MVADTWGPRRVSPRGSGHVGVAHEAAQKQAGSEIGSLLGFWFFFLFFNLFLKVGNWPPLEILVYSDVKPKVNCLPGFESEFNLTTSNNL